MKTLNGFKNYLDKEDELLTNEQLQKQASNQLASFVYLQNADKPKYGSILKILNDKNSLKNDQHPKKMLDATNVLSNNRYDNASQTKYHKK